MTDHPYFQPAAAGWEQALELDYELEHIHKLNRKEVNQMTFSVSKLKNSRYLKKEDCGDGLRVTIVTITEENVAIDGEPIEKKWIVSFKEPDVKPMVLNSTNGEAIAEIAGGDTEEEWAGTQIILYHDPNVSFAGKRVGGIRVRAPQKAKTGGKAPPVDADFDNDVRF